MVDRALIPSLVVALLVVAGCQSPMARLDRSVEGLLAESSGLIGEQQTADYEARGGVPKPSRTTYRSWADEQPPTVNPPAERLDFRSAGDEDTEVVLERLRAYSELPADAAQLDLPAALTYAIRHSREYRFAEEEFVLAVLRLLIERHLWGPRFFNDVSALLTGTGDDGLFDTSVRLVNEFGVTQRLPYGGEVSARLLARVSEDLTNRVSVDGVQSADLILAANVPLLRGAGLVAREDLIQTERDLVYAARAFARFRREFLFEIATVYLGLVVDRQQIENSRQSVESFEQVEAREIALYRGGRSTPFEADEAKNNTLESVDRLNGIAERYRLAVDRFKVRINWPLERPLEIVSDGLGLPTPEVGLDEAVYTAMNLRLDLQTQRDQIVDSRRRVEVARNNLLGDLDLSATVTMTTDDTINRPGLDLDLGDTAFVAGITYGLPLDREIERLNLRRAEIGLERSERAYGRFRDEIATNVRAAVRGIDRSLFSLRIQETNVEIAANRVAAIEADPDRADIRQKTDAITQVTLARDQRDSAQRDLEVAVLGYLLATGQLRVGARGYVQPLEGMEIQRPPAEGPEDGSSS